MFKRYQKKNWQRSRIISDVYIAQTRFTLGIERIGFSYKGREALLLPRSLERNYLHDIDISKKTTWNEQVPYFKSISFRSPQAKIQVATFADLECCGLWSKHRCALCLEVFFECCYESETMAAQGYLRQETCNCTSPTRSLLGSSKSIHYFHFYHFSIL